MNPISIKASADVGNSSTKIIVLDGVSRKSRIQPTSVAYLPAVPSFEDDELTTLVANLHKNMVVHITSPSITHSGIYAVGDIANVYGGSGFDIEQHKKADHNNTIIQPMAMIAAAAVQNEFERNKKLPMSLFLEVEYTTAIPVVDYSKADARMLESRLMCDPSRAHVVVVYVGEGMQVHVTINVKAAKVVPEGIPAFYALINSSESMFASYNKRYSVNFSGEDFTNRKILFVDIGDGTTELIYFEDGKPVVKKTDGMRAGVGHASEKAIEAFKDRYKIRGKMNRTTYMKKVLNESDKWHYEASQELKLTTHEQEEQILIKIKKMIENVLSYDLDDIVVFGGGTNVFTNLEHNLINYADDYKLRVLWINGKAAALLNAIGLNELNTKVYFKG